MTTETGEVLQTTPNPEASPEQVAPPTDVTATPEDVQKQAEPKTFTQDELDLAVQRRLAKQERQHNREVRELLTQPRSEPRSQEPKEPQRDSFASDGEWIDAKVEYRLGLREQASRQEREAETHRQTASKTEKIYAEASKLPGFDRDEFEALPLTPVIAQTIVDSDIGHKLMAHMTANPDVVERIAKLSPARQAAEIGRLEEKLSAPKETKLAPAPIKPLGGGGGPVHNGDLSKMSMDQYIAARQKQGARWAR